MRCTDRSGRCSITADGLEAYVRDRIGVALGARASIIRDDGGTLDQAHEAMALADSDLTRWSGDDRARDLMGDAAWYRGIADRTAKLEAAQAGYRAEASRANRTTVIPALTDLQDPEQFKVALNAVVKKIVIGSGRAAVKKRVTIEWVDEVDLPMAQQESPFYENASAKAIDAAMQALASGHRSTGFGT